jgi:hypothetical protein
MLQKAFIYLLCTFRYKHSKILLDPINFKTLLRGLCMIQKTQLLVLSNPTRYYLNLHFFHMTSHKNWMKLHVYVPTRMK